MSQTTSLLKIYIKDLYTTYTKYNTSGKKLEKSVEIGVKTGEDVSVQQRAVQRYIYPVDLTGVEEDLELISARLRIGKAEAIREAVSRYAAEVRGMKVIELRELSKNEAAKEILAYLKKNKKAFTSQIADDLRLDIVQVNEILRELAEKGAVK